MNLNAIKNRLLGSWKGTNNLYLRWMTPQEYPSASTLHITPTVGGKFLALSYTWSHEEQPQEGLILVGYEASKDIVHASWIDSWHANEKPMALTGTITLQGNLDMRGSYSVENHPDWGWRIVLTPADTALQMRMYNVTPEGEEDLAVQADYHKQANS